VWILGPWQLGYFSLFQAHYWFFPNDTLPQFKQQRNGRVPLSHQPYWWRGGSAFETCLTIVSPLDNVLSFSGNKGYRRSDQHQVGINLENVSGPINSLISSR